MHSENENESEDNPTNTTKAFECYKDEDGMRKDEEGHDDMITVKFIIPPKNRVFTNSYHVNLQITEVINSLSNIFNMPRDSIVITHEGEEVPFDVKLQHLNIDAFGILTLGLTNSNNAEFKVDDLYKDMAIADIITVHCEADHCDPYDLIVEIEDKRIIKPFTGGYKNKINNIEYHHAFTQTGPPASKISPYLLQSRDCQTITSIDVNQQTSCTNSTQMQSEHICIPSVTNKILTPGKYKSELSCIDQNIDMQIKNDLRKERMHDIVVQTYPRNKNDLLMLQSVIANWHQQETESIQKMYSGAPKHAELNMLLEKEIKMLQVVQARKKDSIEENNKLKDYKILTLSQKPVTWTGYKGLKIEMDTLKTQYARRLSIIYNSISKEEPVESRLETLMSLRSTLEENPTNISIDIIELIDRESELLIRQINAKDIQILRKRLKQLLMKYMKSTNTFKCLESDSNCLSTKDHHICKYCSRIRPAKMISLHSCTKYLNACASCISMVQTQQKNYGPFAKMLQEVRCEEQKNNSLRSVIFIMNVVDMQKLVDTIWHGQSALSTKTEKLQAPKWDRRRNWSPWNCIILTREETCAHMKITDLEKAYDHSFIAYVKLKHLLAKNMFKQLAEVDENFKEAQCQNNVH
ncbi:IQ and ubiquitin-like domain-containing protein [Ctenocephalides felis]|uniref:IQ and ubiquitin-like domain-containing protein n=1 Tax=Ctenocephalides felis TaxID=7515 RepID=UPI000E6E4CA8|nr:IQ and ubiquitin-like domain-containing protein [Ctenocephalides felis]